MNELSGETVQVTINLPLEMWQAFQWLGESEGLTVPDVIERMLIMNHEAALASIEEGEEPSE